MNELIEQKLKAIVGLPVWAVGRTAHMFWVAIGERRTVKAWGGGTKEVGEFALHIDCPWRWSSRTMAVADQDSSLDQLSNRLKSTVLCQRVSATSRGSLEITFSDGTTLSVPVDSHDTGIENEEMWRFFRPGTDEPHFVVGSQGIS